MSAPDDDARWQAQTGRIKESLNKLLGPDQHHVTLIHSDGEITFRVEGPRGGILAEDLRGTKVSEIEAMSDGALESRLREMFRDLV